MRKTVIILLMLLVFGLTACEPEHVPNGDSFTTESQETESFSPVEKVQFNLSGTVAAATKFSNGYAIVKTAEEKVQNYIINKNGGVVAVLPAIVFDGSTTHGAKVSEFRGGFALISDSSAKNFDTICDIEGNLYKADDFSVTAFHPDALTDGYILTSTAAEGDKGAKIGVLGLDMNWIVEPSEELAQTIGFTKVNGAQNLSKFYKNHIVYGEKASFDVRNGAILSMTYSINGKKEESADSANWELENGVYCYDDGEKKIPKVNLSKLVSLDYNYMTLAVDGAAFVDGKAPVVFGEHNKQTIFSLINQSGELVFEPVETGEHIKKILISDNFVLVAGETELKTYDFYGRVIGKLENIDIDNFSAISFCDQVVVLEKLELKAEGPQNVIYFYNAGLETLF